MIIDSETFTDLAVHLKLASDAVLSTTQHLSAMGTQPVDSAREQCEWEGTIESMMSVNHQITVIEQLLRAVMEANQTEDGSHDTKGGSFPC